MIGQKIKTACETRGLTLARACRISGVNYQTLHSQISKGREIPFSSVEKLSSSLKIPITDFTSQSCAALVNSQDVGNMLAEQTAKIITETLTKELAKTKRSGFSVTTDHVLDWLQSEGGILKNFVWMAEEVDLFQPLEPEHRIVHPYKIGKDSLSTKFFGLNNETDYLKVVGKFEQPLIDRVMCAHSEVRNTGYLVTEEAIDVIAKGVPVRGTYRRIIAAVKDENNRDFNFVFSKLTSLAAG